MWLFVIDDARSFYQPRFFLKLMDQKPWVNRYTMPADTRTWLQNINPWMLVGEVDQVVNIQAFSLAKNRKLVRERDIHIAKRVLCEFDHFGHARIGFVAMTRRQI